MIIALLLSLGPLCPPALAGDEDDDLHETTMPSVPLAAPTAGATDAAEPPLDELPAAPGAPSNTAYPLLSMKAAEVLHIDVVFADRCRKAIELIYARKYPESRRQLDALSKDYPTSGIGPVGTAVIYQALMFENFDFKFETQYKVAHDQAIRQLSEGQKLPGNEAIEWFLRAGITGIDAIDQARRGEYLAALASGIDAVSAMAEAKTAAPQFVDPLFGDGLYLYWRTVIARASPLIPDGPDDREAGKTLMKRVEKEGVLLGPAGTLALTYSYMEEHDLKNALARSMYGRLSYPDNVINNMTAGRILASMRRYDSAAGMYREVLKTVPDNQRAHYHLGVVYSRQSKFPEAESEFKTYVAFTDPPGEALGQAWYRLGLLYVRQGRTADAKSAYGQAVTTGHNEAARKALTKLP